MSDEADRLEGENAIQRDPNKLRKWVLGNLIKFYKAKYKVLLLGQVSTTEWTESSPEEKRLGGVGGQEAAHDAATCAGSSVVSWAASKAKWAAEEGGDSGGDSASLPHSGETPPAELPPALDSQHSRDVNLPQ